MHNLIEVRHTLHKNAELSGNEVKTARFLYDLLEKLNIDSLISNVGGYGLLAVFDRNVPGPCILFRADIDALPIQENTDLNYKSINDGVSHKCGHDGHSSILYGFAKHLSNNRPLKGRVILLFQPAEETGKGASAVIKELNNYNIDYSFALHNLPGYPLNSIVYRNNIFACASKGITIILTGINSHASEPEKGISPANALAYLINELPQMSNLDLSSEEYSLITVVHASLGEVSFGIAPGNAKLMVTLRAASNRVLDQQVARIEKIVHTIAIEQDLKFEIHFSEEFPAMINDIKAIEIIKSAAQENNDELIENKYPFKWSEDFAHFSTISKSALIGIGAGENHLPLHNPDYDFPDEIMLTAVNLWKKVVEILMNTK